MVSRGEWGPGDDRRMLRSLLASGVSREWEVNWEALVEGRNAAAVGGGAVCVWGGARVAGWGGVGEKGGRVWLFAPVPKRNPRHQKGEGRDG